MNLSIKYKVFNTYLYFYKDPPIINVKIFSSVNPIDYYLAVKWSKEGLLQEFFKDFLKNWWKVIDIIEFAIINTISSFTIRIYGLSHEREENITKIKDLFKDNKFITFELSDFFCIFKSPMVVKRYED